MRHRTWSAAATILLSFAIVTSFGMARDAGRAPQAALPETTFDDWLALQVRLDRAGYSPGEIDGHDGANTARALRAFQRREGLEPTGRPDAETERALVAIDPADVLTTYEITEDDVAGPFEPDIPGDLMDQAALPTLAYTSALEMLGERFHASPRLLRRLNPNVRFDRGDAIRAPNVAPAPAARQPWAAVVVTVSKAESALSIESETGEFLFHAPVTTGSDRDPLPIGEWVVTGIFRDPAFHYNPDLFWDADPAHSKAKIAPGPNNPVGVVWIDLSRDHYGLHGSPEPRLVGRTQSHGCVRLTNWDALRVASLVSKGTPVRFRE